MIKKSFLSLLVVLLILVVFGRSGSLHTAETTPKTNHVQESSNTPRHFKVWEQDLVMPDDYNITECRSSELGDSPRSLSDQESKALLGNLRVREGMQIYHLYGKRPARYAFSMGDGRYVNLDYGSIGKLIQPLSSAEDAASVIKALSRGVILSEGDFKALVDKLREANPKWVVNSESPFFGILSYEKFKLYIVDVLLLDGPNVYAQTFLLDKSGRSATGPKLLLVAGPTEIEGGTGLTEGLEQFSNIVQGVLNPKPSKEESTKPQ